MGESAHPELPVGVQAALLGLSRSSLYSRPKAPSAEEIALKQEVYLQSYDTPRAARQSLARYFQFYNHQRPHQALGYQTPAALYFATRVAATAGDDSGKGEASAFCVFPTPSVS